MKTFEVKALLASFIIVLVIRTLLRLVNSNWLADGNFFDFSGGASASFDAGV